MKNLYRNDLDKACFVHEAANSDSKDLAKRPISENILEDRTYEIDRNCQYDGYQRVLARMVHKLFYKKAGSRVNLNEQLSEANQS